MWNLFSLLCTIFIITSHTMLHCIPFCSATCTSEQLDVSQIQRALDKCRKSYFSYGETAPLRELVPSTTNLPSRSDNSIKPTTPPPPITEAAVTTDDTISVQPLQPTYFASSQAATPLSQLVYPILIPPAAFNTDHVTQSSVFHQVGKSPLTNLIRRAPRSFGSLSNDATSPHATLKLERGSWGVGANDKKCVFYCAYVELGLMDEEGRLVEGQLRRLLEGAARSNELKARAGELVELCQYKMLHVSTIDPTQMECDYPLMLTRCVLGRLSKHCEDHARQQEKQTLRTIHPDVELL